eukprot:gnl/TRDRNA2_/TRDRNA2_55108_c0_seq1.p1 gnl/TRDRNA2_/TRDRNA2_55108_c0~~gnl/TRDRNA2_/TRDRNA2_55108_c0_seq1.p1  ORF type:complete len:139 (-),score=29.36 gnl/TRDRNA2_/TRDRNA2_55108_c0_seq1:206-622(-)
MAPKRGLIVAALVFAVGASDADPKLVIFPDDAEAKASLTVQAGDHFRLQVPNMVSTGFNWFFGSITPPSLAKALGNVTGGGETSPPYLNATFEAGSQTQNGTIVLVHAKPWELSDPKAEKGHATLSVSVQAKIDSLVI